MTGDGIGELGSWSISKDIDVGVFGFGEGGFGVFGFGKERFGVFGFGEGRFGVFGFGEGRFGAFCFGEGGSEMGNSPGRVENWASNVDASKSGLAKTGSVSGVWVASAFGAAVTGEEISSPIDGSGVADIRDSLARGCAKTAVRLC